MKIDLRSKKKLKWLSIIKKNNQFSAKLSKYVGWQKIDLNNYYAKILRKYYNINEGYFYYVR